MNNFLWKKSNNLTLNENKGVENKSSSLGNKISISKCGKIFAVGDIENRNNKGLITLYNFSGSQKEQQEIFTLKGESEEEMLGHCFELSGNGNMLITGEPYYNSNTGRIRIFNLSTDERFEVEGDDIEEYFGWDVSINKTGSTLGIVCNNDEKGHLKIFRSPSGSENSHYENIQDISDDHFCPLNVTFNSDGNIFAVSEKLKLNLHPSSSHHEKDNHLSTILSEGRIRLFKYSSEESIYKEFGSCPISGCKIDGLHSFYNFKLNASGNIIIIGENGFSTVSNKTNKKYCGRVRVYKYCNFAEDWFLLGNEFIGENTGDCCGSSVDINNEGNIIAIGEQQFSTDKVMDCGRVRVFEFVSTPSGRRLAFPQEFNSSDTHNGQWVQIGQSIQGEYEGDNTGVSIRLTSDGNNLFVGEPKYKNTGRVRFFEKSFEENIVFADGEEVCDFDSFSKSLKPLSLRSSDEGEDDTQSIYTDNNNEEFSIENDNISITSDNNKSVITAVLKNNKVIEGVYNKNKKSVKILNRKRPTVKTTCSSTTNCKIPLINKCNRKEKCYKPAPLTLSDHFCRFVNYLYERCVLKWGCKNSDIIVIGFFILFLIALSIALWISLKKN